jgi:hypothetical protein
MLLTPSSSDPALAPQIPPLLALTIFFPLQHGIPSIVPGYILGQLPQQAHLALNGTVFCKDAFEDLYVVDMAIE